MSQNAGLAERARRGALPAGQRAELHAAVGDPPLPAACRAAAAGPAGTFAAHRRRPTSATTSASRNPNRVVPFRLARQVPLNIEVGNRSWAGWAPQLMHMPVHEHRSLEHRRHRRHRQDRSVPAPRGSGSGPGKRVCCSTPRSTHPRRRVAIGWSSTRAPSPTATTSCSCRRPRRRAEEPSELRRRDLSVRRERVVGRILPDPDSHQELVAINPKLGVVRQSNRQAAQLDCLPM